MLHCVGFQHTIRNLLLNSDKESKKIEDKEAYMDKSHRHSVIRYIILIAVFIAAFFLLYLFFSSREVTEYVPPVAPVETVKGEMRTIEEKITVTGYIEPDSMIPVVPFVSGTIDEYDIAAGRHVEEGDVLAVIDKTPYELQKAQAEAQVKALRASYERVDALCKEGGVSGQDHDTLKAQLDAAEAQLELADLQLSYATVTAPISGTILRSMSSAGSPASSETPLCVISDLSDLVVNLKVGEKYYTTIRNTEGLKIRIYSDAQGLSSDAEIISVDPMVDPVSKTFGIRVRLTSPEGFVPGMFIKADVILSSGEYLTLPLAVRKLDGSVYALSDDGSTAEYLELEDIAEDDEYFAIDGEYAGREFIIRGQDSLLPGVAVRKVPSEV